jgi:hypothetical protein
MNQMLNKTLALALVLLPFPCFQGAARAQDVGDLAPEISLEAAFGGLDAATMTLASLRGQVVVLDFWATW